MQVFQNGCILSVINNGRGAIEMRGRKLSIEEVTSQIESKGFKLIEYSGKMSTISRFECENGHQWSTKAISVTSGVSGCPECSRIAKMKYTPDSINKLIADRGLKLISYGGNVKTPSSFRCSKGHEWSTNATTVLRGFGCPHCAGQARIDVSDIRAKLQKRNINLLAYGGSVKKQSTFQCEHGHEWNTKTHHVLNGSGCPRCAGRSQRTTVDINHELNVRKIKLINYAGNVSDRSIFECEKGHQWEAITSNVLHLHTGCPECCTAGTSKGEQAIFDYIKSVHPDAIQSDRNVIAPFELDVVVPSLKLAVEFNGIYWHSEKYRDDTYHINKRKMTEQAGYRLISIREDLWNERRPQIEAIINNALGVNTRRVYARKCTIVAADKDTAAAFFDANHVQGNRAASQYWSLVHNGETVAVMSATHWRKKDEWELVRYATSCNVVGGLSKLWKHIVKVNNITRAYSYVDRDLFTGESYGHAGFKYDSTTVGFRIVTGETTESRQKWNNAPDGLTQNEWYEREGVCRIYDAGQDKLIFG